MDTYIEVGETAPETKQHPQKKQHTHLLLIHAWLMGPAERPLLLLALACFRTNMASKEHKKRAEVFAAEEG